MARTNKGAGTSGINSESRRKAANNDTSKPTKKRATKGFPKGVSGNPAGRPRGSRNKKTILLEQLLDGEAETIFRKCIELAKQGDRSALKLCLERVLPPARSTPVSFTLPELKTTEDLCQAYDAVLQAAANGEITLEEAERCAALLERKRKFIETFELEQRLSRLEAWRTGDE